MLRQTSNVREQLWHYDHETSTRFYSIKRTSRASGTNSQGMQTQSYRTSGGMKPLDIASPSTMQYHLLLEAILRTQHYLERNQAFLPSRLGPEVLFQIDLKTRKHSPLDQPHAYTWLLNHTSLLLYCPTLVSYTLLAFPTLSLLVSRAMQVRQAMLDRRL